MPLPEFSGEEIIIVLLIIHFIIAEQIIMYDKKISLIKQKTKNKHTFCRLKFLSMGVLYLTIFFKYDKIEKRKDI